ncbi:MAG: PhnD/SsuA/transferrin family substrate-binding protein [Candidatus Sumerlaeaceae bacterium]
MKLRYCLGFPLLLVCLHAIVMPAHGQATTATLSAIAGFDSTAPTTGTAFRIGCLRYDPDTRISVELAQQLAASLRANEKVRAAMQQEGVSEIQVQSFDSHRWLMEAMDGEQVDLAFCSLVDFGYQTGGYLAIFLLRLPHDRPGRNRLFHYGSIFVNNRSSLFRVPDHEIPARLSEYLASHEIALVGPYSAAGYFYPLLKIHEITSGTLIQPRAQFWGSSEEVVKAVINGTVEIGTCDAGVLDEVLRASNLLDRRQELIREIKKVERVPPDPVALLQKWAPKSSPLGRSVRDATRKFFDELKPPLPRLMPSPDDWEFNRELRQNITRFDEIRKAVDTGAK